MLIEHTKILKIIEKLDDMAQEVEADVGATPTATEALDWLRSEIYLIVNDPAK
jgi:hypothetical protein